MHRGESSRSLWAARRVIAPTLFLGFSLLLSGCTNANFSNKTPVSASSTKPSAVVLGYLWDSRVSGIRAITGTPGAAHLESPVAGSSWSAATSCANRNFALLGDASGALWLMSLPSGDVTPLGQGIAKGERIALSPACGYGVISSPGSAQVLLVSGLPSSPQMQPLNFRGGGSILGTAVSDQGSILLATLNSSAAAVLEVLPPAGQWQTLRQLRGYGGMAFLPGGDSAIFADSVANSVYLVAQTSGNPKFTQLASSAQGVANPVAVAGSADGRFAFVANAQGKTILRFDLASGSAPASTPCACSPSELIPMAGNALFQLNDPATGTVYALAGDSPTLRTVFIPTDNPGPANGGSK